MAIEPSHIRRGMVVISRLLDDTRAGRPGVVIRADSLARTPWAAVLPFTTDLGRTMPHWLPVEPTSENGLRQASRLMTDRPMTVWCDRIREVIGRLDEDAMATATKALAAALGL